MAQYTENFLYKSELIQSHKKFESGETTMEVHHVQSGTVLLYGSPVLKQDPLIWFKMILRFRGNVLLHSWAFLKNEKKQNKKTQNLLQKTRSWFSWTKIFWQLMQICYSLIFMYFETLWNSLDIFHISFYQNDVGSLFFR